jgi:hypothetical protein
LGKGPPVPIVQEAGWAPEPIWTQRLEEKSFTAAEDRTSIARSSIPKPDTILTELPWFPIQRSTRLKYEIYYHRMMMIIIIIIINRQTGLT